LTSLAELAEVLGSERFSHKTLADGSGVLLDIEGMRVLSLNATGAFLLDEIAAGALHTQELVDRLTEAFEVDRITAAGDVEELVEDLERVLSRARSKPGRA